LSIPKLHVVGSIPVACRKNFPKSTSALAEFALNLAHAASDRFQFSADLLRLDHLRSICLY